MIDYWTLFVSFLGIFAWEYIALLYEKSKNKIYKTKENDKPSLYFFKIKPSYGLIMLKHFLRQVFTQIGKFFGYCHGQVVNCLKYVWRKVKECWNYLTELLKTFFEDFYKVCQNLFVPTFKICTTPFYAVKGYYAGLKTTLSNFSTKNYILLGLTALFALGCLIYVGYVYRTELFEMYHQLTTWEFYSSANADVNV